MKVFSIAKFLAVIIGLSIVASPIFADISKTELFREKMRELWTDHVVWTHEYIVSAVSDIPNVKLVADRLLRNQEDIGNALIPFYGNSAGQAVTKLLKEHILIAADLVTAAKAGNQKNVKQIDAKWHKNAQEIAAFLAKANPNWPQKDLLDMLNHHLQLTSDSAVAQLKQQWAKDIGLYDQIREQILGMADALAGGIIKQFPKKFQTSIVIHR
jgi:hypothetical protein